MKQRIAVILTVVLLQLMAVACTSASHSQRVHTVCPEAAMTLSDNHSDAPKSEIGTRLGIDLQAASVGNSGFEVYTAQSEVQLRTNQWQWQRIMRDKIKEALQCNSLSSLIAFTTFRHHCSEPSSHSGYVYAIRHIII